MTIDDLLSTALLAARRQTQPFLVSDPSFARLDGIMHQIRDTAAGAKWAALGYGKLLQKPSATTGLAEQDALRDTLVVGFLTAAIEYAIEVSRKPLRHTITEDEAGWRQRVDHFHDSQT